MGAGLDTDSDPATARGPSRIVCPRKDSVRQKRRTTRRMSVHMRSRIAESGVKFKMRSSSEETSQKKGMSKVKIYIYALNSVRESKRNLRE